MQRSVCPLIKISYSKSDDSSDLYSLNDWSSFHMDVLLVASILDNLPYTLGIKLRHYTGRGLIHSLDLNSRYFVALMPKLDQEEVLINPFLPSSGLNALQVSVKVDPCNISFKFRTPEVIHLVDSLKSRYKW